QGDREVGFADVLLERQVATEQNYIGNSAVLATVLTDSAGNQVRIVDYMPRFKQYERSFRPPQLIRRIEPLKGLPRIILRVRPMFNYGATAPQRVPGSNHIRFLSPDGSLRVSTNAPISYIDAETPFVLTDPVTMIMGPDESLQDSIVRVGSEFLERTLAYWADWTRALAIPFEWQDAVIRAAVTLKLSSVEETGAIVAALTTSIPEAPNTPRTWDYRYCWLRDAYFTVGALNRLGATRTMEHYLRYITTATTLTSGALRPVYGVTPDVPLTERIIPALAGYRGMGPVRIGNQAAEQVQNDVYGSVILGTMQLFFDRRLHRGDPALYERLKPLGRQAVAVALEPDASIWEYRGRARVHTHSALLCWAACDRLARIAEQIGQPGAQWRVEADRIRAAIDKHAWSPAANSFTESFGGTGIDASLLLMRELGFVAADDPRYLGTLAAVESRLRRGRHLLRYDSADDFGEPETAFNVCTFWYIQALAAVGRRDEARELFCDVLACRNRLGLLSEDLDTATGELWGNFPQTYSMVGIVLCAMQLSKSWEEGFWRGL
ncbi:MAG: glycoside hydrolase family 15 protein, partial [Alphaproteobacteria bacterium]